MIWERIDRRPRPRPRPRPRLILCGQVCSSVSKSSAYALKPLRYVPNFRHFSAGALLANPLAMVDVVGSHACLIGCAWRKLGSSNRPAVVGAHLLPNVCCSLRCNTGRKCLRKCQMFVSRKAMVRTSNLLRLALMRGWHTQHLLVCAPDRWLVYLHTCEKV